MSKCKSVTKLQFPGILSNLARASTMAFLNGPCTKKNAEACPPDIHHSSTFLPQLSCMILLDAGAKYQSCLALTITTAFVFFGFGIWRTCATAISIWWWSQSHKHSRTQDPDQMGEPNSVPHQTVSGCKCSGKFEPKESQELPGDWGEQQNYTPYRDQKCVLYTFCNWHTSATDTSTWL